MEYHYATGKDGGLSIFQAHNARTLSGKRVRATIDQSRTASIFAAAGNDAALQQPAAGSQNAGRESPAPDEHAVIVTFDKLVTTTEQQCSASARKTITR